MFLGTAADLMEVARKGLKVNFKVLGSVMTLIDVPSMGIDAQGILGIASVEARVNATDSSKDTNTSSSAVDARTGLVTGTNVKVNDVGEVVDTDYAYTNSKTISIGDVKITAGSVKVKLNGKEIKVISDAKIDFDATDKTDEVKLVLTGTTYTLVFESPVIDDKDLETAAATAKMNEAVTIEFKRTERLITQTELTSFPINEDVYTELNGKEVSLAKALYRGSYFFVRTNTENEIIYVDAFYKDAVCKIDKIDKDNLSISGMKFGNKAFTDVVKLSPDALISDANGNLITIQQALKAAKVIISTDPAFGYEVISIQVVE
jgi:hypothetical protein